MPGQTFVTRAFVTAPAQASFVVAPPALAPPRASIAGSGAVATGAEQGPAGPAGTDHGYVSYGEMASAPPIVLLPGVRQQLTFSSSAANEILATSPFAGHVFWDGFKVQARKRGDTAILRLDLASTAYVANGNIEIQVDIGGTLGVIQTVARALKKPAGQAEPISEAFPVYVGSTFLADGAALFLEASVPTEIAMVGLVVFPLSAAP